MPIGTGRAKLSGLLEYTLRFASMPHRISRRDVDQFRITLFLLENGQRVPTKLLQRYLELKWLEEAPLEPSGYAITAEGVRRRHFE